MSLSWFLFTKSGGDKLARNAIGGITGQKTEHVQTSQTPQIQKEQPQNTMQNLDIECRKGVNVEKPECVKWFDQITKSGASVSPGESRQTTVSYNPSEPFDSDIQKQVSYEVTAKPVFSGCTKFGSKYQAYTQQGTKLDVSQADCERLIKQNDRPFNYFVNEREERKVESQDSNQLAQASPVDYKLQELAADNNQANNVIVETRTLSYSKDIHHIN
jgi:hypothetical protein